MYKNDYSIKHGYQCNPRQEYTVYVDELETSKSFQVAVYRYAKHIAQSISARNVLDIGCGSGFKLIEFIAPICSQITGVDNERNIENCRKACFGTWVVDDLEHSTGSVEGPYDLIISSDVIEHLADPVKLLEYMRKHAHEHTRIIISTPERDLVRGSKNFHPPPKTPHVREWNREEFRNFLEGNNFVILDHFLVPYRRLPTWSALRYGLGLVKQNLSLADLADIESIVEILKNLKLRLQLKTCQVCLCKINIA